MPTETWRKRFAGAVLERNARFWSSDMAVMTTLALIIGVAAGIGTALIARAVSVLNLFTFAAAGGAQIWIVIFPAAGALLAALVARLARADYRGLAVSEAVAALATRGGQIQPLAAAARALSGVLTIGFGGSAGLEGPAVHLSSGIAAACSRLLRLNPRRAAALVAASAAAGISATFGAPLAGIMFGLEVVLGQASLHSASALVVAAVAASFAAQQMAGQDALLPLPALALHSLWELPLYAVLGLLAAGAAAALARVLATSENAIAGWRLPSLLKPALAGLGVGIIGYVLPQVLSTGYGAIREAAGGQLAFGLLIALFAGKMLASALTLGSGGAGGILTPALFAGAMLGGVYGQAAHALLPGLALAGGGAYALVGMVAVLSVVAGAPVTSILLLAELTAGTALLVPALLAIVAGTWLAHELSFSSVFAAQLRRRGVPPGHGLDANLMRSLVVEDAMTPIADTETVPSSMTMPELSRLFHSTAHHGFIVIDRKNELFGIVALADLERAMEQGRVGATVGDICTREVVTVHPDETLQGALRHLAALDIGRLPVVDRADERHVLGVLRRGDIVRAYAHALTEAPKDEEALTRARLQAAVGAELAEFVLGPLDAAGGHRLRELRLPPDCVVISIHRRGAVVVPRGNTSLLQGDRIIILKVSTPVDELRRILRQGPGA